ncbi:hypothetical protein NMY22_g4822 [Coprinellus aureogranulatus]|nr:hypothetical protein NMY22_g4822 [Coprinellus aureogranulatus]
MATAAKWINYLITQGSHPTHGPAAILCCSSLLSAVCTAARTDQFMAEIASMSSTAGSVYRLLCLKDGRTGVYYTVPHPVGPCRIANIFSIMQKSEKGWAAMLYKLNCMRRSERKGVLSAIICRVRETGMNSHEGGVYEAIRSTVYLITGALLLGKDVTLWRELRRQSFLTMAASALYDMSKKAESSTICSAKFWEYLAVCISRLLKAVTLCSPSNLTVGLIQLLDGDLMACAAVCIPHLLDSPEESLVAALELVFPYFHISRLRDAAASNDEEPYVWATPLLDLKVRSMGMLALRCSYQECITIGKLTFVLRRNSDINLRQQHVAHCDSEAGHYEETVKMCSGCRSVNYCSVICQMEDWAEFHSKECRELARSYEEADIEQRVMGTLIPMRAKADQLKFLDTCINMHLSLRSPTEASENPLAVAVTHSEPNLKLTTSGPLIAVVDHYATEKRVIFQHSPFDEQLDLARTSPLSQPWIPRIERWAQDAEKNPSAAVLAQGIFRVSEVASAFVFAKMQYTPERAVGEKYSILNSCSWVGATLAFIQMSANKRGNRKPPQHSSSYSDPGVQLRRKLLDQADSCAPEDLQALARYLKKEKDTIILMEVLDEMDASRLPSPENLRTARKNIQIEFFDLATRKIISLLCIFHCPQIYEPDVKNNSDLSSFKARCILRIYDGVYLSTGFGHGLNVSSSGLIHFLRHDLVILRSMNRRAVIIVAVATSRLRKESSPYFAE